MKSSLSKFFLIFILTVAFSSFAFSQDTLQEGINLYDKGNIKESVEFFEKYIKENPNDDGAQIYLALSLTKSGRIREAEIALGKILAREAEINDGNSRTLNSNQLKARKTLTYLFIARGRLSEAVRQAEYIISLDRRDAEIYYLLGLANLRLGKTDAALENAEQSLRHDGEFNNANLLKAQALLNRKTELNDYAAIAAKFRAASDSLNAYVEHLNESSNLNFWREQRENLKYFVDYYDAQQKSSAYTKDNKAKDSTPIKLLSKRSAKYTDQARAEGITGSVNLLVAFNDNGEISRVLILRNLGYGLDEEAINAAKSIKFEPETQNGKPLLTTKFISYSFELY